ncbi:MAG: PEP/pyruvate-binding domain-containing protein [Bacilli bacterium]|nr:PEP/pyruvate-binding domain-containing protein [Bacilli bacterium]
MKIQKITKSNKINEFGGKALGLQKLLNIGVKVPEAFVLDEEYICFLLNNKNEPELLDMLSKFSSYTYFAVRSSASNEDNEKESFAGMYETKLNVPNDLNDIIQAVDEVYKSKNSLRVQAYNNEKSLMNVIVQEMIDPKVAGVCFTNAIDFNGEDIIYIEYVYGLGDELVSGRKNAYILKINRHTLNIIENNDENFKQEMFNDLINDVAKIINQSKEKLDIEWCINNQDESYFVQARPITKNVIIQKHGLNGAIASSGVCSGVVYIIDEDLEDEEFEIRLNNFPIGGIMLAKTTETEYVPAMKRASGIITTEGSVLAHAAIIARELAIPCITGYKSAFDEIKEGDFVQINTNVGTLTINEKEVSIGEGKEVNLLGLYIFNNVIEEIIDDKIILVEQIQDEFGVHVEENLTKEEIEKIDIFIRKKYKQAPIILEDQKYLWYFEWKRYLKIPGYKLLVEEANNIVKNLDGEGLIVFKNKVIDIWKSVYSFANSEYDQVFASELGQALYFLINLYICNGIALEKIISYKNIFTDISLKELLNPNNKNRNLSIASIFLRQVEDIRGTIWTEFLKNAITTTDYFEEREEKIRSVTINSSNYDDILIDNFYTDLVLNNKIINVLTERNNGKKL